MRYKPVALIATALLLVALLEMPYGYYTFLRIAVFLTAAFGAYRGTHLDNPRWSIGLGMIAILFNPFIPMEFSRDTWLGLNVIAAGAMGLSAFRVPEPDELPARD